VKKPNARRPAWERGRIEDQDNDPLVGFANIMDVMLVFALGLILALVARSPSLRQDLGLEQPIEVSQGRELVELPESINQNRGAEGMESLGQVYRDPKTGKLILIGAK